MSPRKKKADKEVVFSRPPFFSEINNPETEKHFNDLAPWQRHLIKRLIDHKDLQRAAQEAGVGRHTKDIVDLKRSEQKSLVESLEAGGITSSLLVTHLLDCLEAKVMRQDKHGDPFPTVDMSLKLKALELIFKIRGDLSKDKSVDDAPKTEDLFSETPV
jgi:hypothetical protein